MNLPGASVARPVFTTMVTLIVVILGAVSLLRVRIDLLPAIEMPTVTVRTGYEGASPEVMERLVTGPLEEIIATVPGVEEMTSESSEGSSIRVRFGWGNDIDTAALDLQSRIEDEINELPDDIVRPRIRKFDVASFPVVILGISSRLDPVELTEVVEDEIRHRFARIPGVAQVDVWGGFDREIRVELDPDRIRAHGLAFDRVLAALRDANLDLPAGRIEQGRHEVTLRAPAEFVDVDEIRDTVVDEQEGSVVTLGQIARIDDTYERLTRIVRVNGERGIRVAIRKQAEANTVEVSEAVLTAIDEANADLPQVHIVPVINQGNFIERSIRNVANSVLYGGGLAIVVLLLFLRNVRSTVVISLAIPISVIATFALVYFGGFTLNLMTLGGLALAVGMMVDSSVVVLENVFRRRDEDGEAPRVAAVEGAREVSTAIVASTITTLVIFLPLVFVRGVAGQLFQEFAYVIVFALVRSLLVSLSLVPMLASRLLKPRGAGRAGLVARLGRMGDRLFVGLDNAYRDLLRGALRLRAVVVVLAVALLAGTLQLLPMIGSEFLPPSDEGEVRVTGELEVGLLDLVDRQTRIIEDIVYPAVPEMVAVVTSVGATGRNAGAASRGELRLTLSPASERTRSNSEVAEDLRKRLAGRVPGMDIRTRAPQGQFILERILGGDEGLTVEIRGYELEVLDALAERVVAVLEATDGVDNVRASVQAGAPQQELAVDRRRVADLVLTVRDVTKALETAVAGSRAGEFRAGGNSYRILVRLADAEKRTMEEILDLTLATPTGDLVALRNVVTTAAGRGPVLIERKEQQRFVEVTADVVDRDLGSVAADVQAALDGIPRPAGYDLHVAGNYEEQQKAFDELVISLVLALVLVYMVLACQYESLRDPLVVMLSVPFAAVGVVLTLFLTHTTLNLQSYIGCIMLGGIVVNNAILLVDQSGRLRARGMRVADAVAEAGRRRLRPILMTTLTTVIALLPLAFGIGEGADAQAPLARAVVGGLIGSTLITLVLVPAVYTVFHPERRERPGMIRVPTAWLAAVVVGLAGCATPDLHPRFAPRWDDALDGDALRSASVPGHVRPLVEPTPTLPAHDADGTLPLSIERATFLALHNNRDIRVRLLGPVIEGTFEALERGAFDPELFARLQTRYERETEISRSTSDSFAVTAKETLLEAGVRQRLPSGTDVEVGVEQQRDVSNRSPELQTARVGVSITQSLLRGAGPQVNLAAVRQAELRTEASLHELRGFVEAVVADALIAYWNLAQARAEAAIQRESLEVAEQQLAETEQRIDVGVLPDTEAAAARAEVARRNQTLLEAESVTRERRLRLVRLIGPDDDGHLDVPLRLTTALSAVTEPVDDLSARIAHAIRHRPELREARVRLEENRLETIVTRNGLLPRLDVFVTLGRSGFADTFPDSFREIRHDLGDVTAGIALSRSLGNRAAEARDARARTERRQAFEAVENLEQLVRLDVRLAANAVERAREQIEAARRTRELEAEVVAAEQARFAVGESTALLVASAQRDLLTARLVELRARTAYRIARVRLHLADGSLLVRSGVRIPAAPGR